MFLRIVQCREYWEAGIIGGPHRGCVLQLYHRSSQSSPDSALCLHLKIHPLALSLPLTSLKYTLSLSASGFFQVLLDSRPPVAVSLFILLLLPGRPFPSTFVYLTLPHLLDFVFISLGPIFLNSTLGLRNRTR